MNPYGSAPLILGAGAAYGRPLSETYGQALQARASMGQLQQQEMQLQEAQRERVRKDRIEQAWMQAKGDPEAFVKMGGRQFLSPDEAMQFDTRLAAISETKRKATAEEAQRAARGRVAGGVPGLEDLATAYPEKFGERMVDTVLPKPVEAKLTTVSPGASVIDGQGNVVYTAPEKSAKEADWKYLVNESGALTRHRGEDFEIFGDGAWSPYAGQPLKKPPTPPGYKLVETDKGYAYLPEDPNSGLKTIYAGVAGKKKEPAATVNVNVGEKSMTKLGEKMSEALITERDSAMEAAKGLESIYEARPLLEKAITGKFATFKLEAGKALQAVGINYAVDPVANTEAYAAAMGSQVGKLIRQFGAGTGLSDADRDYAEKMAGGKITVTKQAIEKILDINQRAYVNVVNNYNTRAGEAMKKPGAQELPYDLRVTLPKQRAPRPPLDAFRTP
jgi:hypothetical protein